MNNLRAVLYIGVMLGLTALAVSFFIEGQIMYGIITLLIAKFTA